MYVEQRIQLCTCMEGKYETYMYILYIKHVYACTWKSEMRTARRFLFLIIINTVSNGSNVLQCVVACCGVLQWRRKARMHP